RATLRRRHLAGRGRISGSGWLVGDLVASPTGRLPKPHLIPERELRSAHPGWQKEDWQSAVSRHSSPVHQTQSVTGKGWTWEETSPAEACCLPKGCSARPRSINYKRGTLMKEKLRSAAILSLTIVVLLFTSSRLPADTGTCGGAMTTLPFTDVMGNIFF